MNIKRIILSLLVTLLIASCNMEPKVTHDVIVIGGSASGVTASVQASRSGATTLLIAEHSWLGGMLTAAGVSCVDGNHNLPSGLFSEFVDSLTARYGNEKALATGWVSHVNFEPQVGNAIFQNMVAAESLLTPMFNTSITDITRKGKVWYVTCSDGKMFSSKALVDATELGDVAASLGVSYDIGMDSREASGETIAPEVANDVIQDLTYVMVLKNYGKDVTINQPASYDAADFYCATKSDKCVSTKPNQAQWPATSMITYGKLPNGYYMINWPIEGNDYYTNIIECDAQERKARLQEAKNFSLCYLYYMQTELGFENYSLADDVFPTEDNFPFIPYHRESRRIHGKVRFNVNHISAPYEQEQALYRTGIAVGDYPIDHHHYRYPQWESLPELHFYPVPSYALPLGVMFPKEIDGLIVAEKSISVSNIVNGSTRLQPVVMQIGQAAGVAAAMISRNEEFSIRGIQSELLAHGVYLLPYLDVDKDDAYFKTYQRIGATGLLEGKGMNVGWSNQTWLQIDSLLTPDAASKGFENYTGQQLSVTLPHNITLTEVKIIIDCLIAAEGLSIEKDKYNAAIQSLNINKEQSITRGEYARLLDDILDPFHAKEVDFDGRFK